VIEEMYRSERETDCYVTYVMVRPKKMAVFTDVKFAIPYHNHASTNFLLDFGATFSFPAMK